MRAQAPTEYIHPASRGQASTEYILLLAALLLILISIYTLSIQMSQRESLLASQLEGERVAARMARALDEVILAGPNSTRNLSLTSSPNQILVVSGDEVLSFGPQNETLAIAHYLANLTTTQTSFAANQYLQINYKNRTTVTITELGS